MKRIAVEIGGTFTDIFYLDDDDMEIITGKVRSTHTDLSCAVIDAIRKIGVDASRVDLLVFGTALADARSVWRCLPLLRDRLDKIAFKGRVLIVTSDGISGVNTVTEKSIDTIASGPVGGLSGAVHIARAIELPNLVLMDAGGTSFDVALIKDASPLARQPNPQMGDSAMPAGPGKWKIAAGGIARVDVGGKLTVGPESTDADPGPMCYGSGGIEPTVTDAALVNGLIDADNFLGGEIALNLDLASQGVDRIAERLGVSPHEAADLILTVACANMTTATKEILVEQSVDPREFALMAYGGAGGLFAAALAHDLGMPRIVIPPHPGVFSAGGMLTMDIIHHLVQPHARALQQLDMMEVAAIFADMEKHGRAMLQEELTADGTMEFIRSVDMCYEGQSHAVEVIVPAGTLTDRSRQEIATAFHDQHQRQYGHRMEVPPRTNQMRLKAVGKFKQVPLEPSPPSSVNIPPDAFRSSRMVYYQGHHVEWVVLDRAYLLPGNTLEGPLIVEERYHNTLVLPGQTLIVDAFSNLIIRNPPFKSR